MGRCRPGAAGQLAFGTLCAPGSAKLVFPPSLLAALSPLSARRGTGLRCRFKDGRGSPVPWRWEGLGAAVPPGVGHTDEAECRFYGTSLFPIPRSAAGDPKPVAPQERCPQPLVAGSS